MTITGRLQQRYDHRLRDLVQGMVLDEHRFGHDGTGAARTRDPGDGRNQMQKKDGEIAHRTILARSWHAQEMPHEL